MSGLYMKNGLHVIDFLIFVSKVLVNEKQDEISFNIQFIKARPFLDSFKLAKIVQVNFKLIFLFLGGILAFQINLFSQNRAPSLYLNYQDFEEGDIIINTLRVLDPSPLYTYYCGLLWNSGLDAGGYCGMQEHPEGKNFIYSLWDPINSSSPITAVYAHPGTEISSFGGEGTGLRSLNFDIGWQENQWYSLVSRTWAIDNQSTLFGFWIYDDSGRRWSHMVTMKYPVPNLKFSTRTSSFIEDWLGNGDKSRTIHHKNGWKRTTNNYQWFAFESSHFDRVFPDAGTINYIENYDGGVKNDEYYFMSSGGSTNPSTNEADVLLDLNNNLQNPSFLVGEYKNLIFEHPGDEFYFEWEIEVKKSPQFSFHVKVYDNVDLLGTPVISIDRIEPQVRSLAVDVSMLPDDNEYYIQFYTKDIFDNHSEVWNEVFVKGNITDSDNDGYFSDVDCDDNNSSINPSQAEIVYNGLNDDCNSATLDDDLDQDGFVLADDCDDGNANVNSSQVEVPYNGLDDDCNSATLDDDLDQDGFILVDDCDDGNASVNSNQIEVPYNGLDDDCNSATLDDDLDQDGFVLADDCDDGNASVNPFAVELANNGIDEDCDGIYLTIEASPLFGPNMISPNGDGYNDNLEFLELDKYSENRLTIFSRWGEKLFESENYQNDWGASKNLKEIPDGVYYYILEYGENSINEFILKRDLLIIRKR